MHSTRSNSMPSAIGLAVLPLFHPGWIGSPSISWHSTRGWESDGASPFQAWYSVSFAAEDHSASRWFPAFASRPFDFSHSPLWIGSCSATIPSLLCSQIAQVPSSTPESTPSTGLSSAQTACAHGSFANRGRSSIVRSDHPFAFSARSSLWSATPGGSWYSSGGRLWRAWGAHVSQAFLGSSLFFSVEVLLFGAGMSRLARI